MSLLLSRSLLFMVFPSILASLLLASPDVPVVYCAAVAPPVALVLSAVNVPEVLAVVRVSTLMSLMLWASLLLPPCLLFFHRLWHPCCCWHALLFQLSLLFRSLFRNNDRNNTSTAGFLAVARVSAVGAFPLAVELSSSTSVSNVTGVQKTFLLFLASLVLLSSMFLLA